MVRNVPLVMCLCDGVFCSKDSGKTIRSIWCSSWLQTLFVLLEFQKLLLFGFDMPLKIQDALVSAFIVLNLIYFLFGSSLHKTGFLYISNGSDMKGQDVICKVPQ